MAESLAILLNQVISDKPELSQRDRENLGKLEVLQIKLLDNPLSVFRQQMMTLIQGSHTGCDLNPGRTDDLMPKLLIEE